MATRPLSDLKNALIVTRTVVTATVSVGMPVKPSTSDTQVAPSADGVDMCGVVVALGPLAGAVGDRIQVALLAGACIIPVKVGTGGATRGKLAKVVSDGFTDAAQSVTTPVAADVAGQFLQSGSAGDMVGMLPGRMWVTE